MTKEFPQGILYAPSRSFVTPTDAALPHRLASDTRQAVEFVGMQHDIRIGYPGHLALARPHIRCRDVHSRSNKIFAHEFCGITARDALQFVNLIGAWIQSNGAFRPAKRQVDDGALQGHQGCQRRHFIEVDVRGKADTALGRDTVMRMLSTIGMEDLHFTADTDGKFDRVHTVAGTDIFQQIGRRFDIACGPVKVFVEYL